MKNIYCLAAIKSLLTRERFRAQRVPYDGFSHHIANCEVAFEGTALEEPRINIVFVVLSRRKKYRFRIIKMAQK